MSPESSGTEPGADVRLEVLPRLDTDEVAAVALLVEQAAEADGVRPVSEQTSLRMRRDDDTGARHVVLRSGDAEGAGAGTVLGYAFLDLAADDEPTAELVVAPAARGRGHGRLLVEQLLRETGDRGIRLWAHGDHPGAAALASSLGLNQARTLLQLRRPLGTAVAEPRVPDGVTVRTFEPGRDDDAWLGLNAVAFADHPEQGAWTSDDLAARLAEPWFDPAGFFLAERDGELVGFHWTKVHADGADDHPIGEVYVVGVRPDQQGTGLGRALTLIGLQHLRDAGLDAVLLYVEADNEAAVSLYTSLGFTPWDTDVVYT